MMLRIERSTTDPTPHWYFHYASNDDVLLRVDVNWEALPPAVIPKVEVLTNLVLTCITALVDHPAEVTLSANANHRRVMFTVRVSNEDVGFAVGQRGQHAEAMRTLLIAACRKLKFHFDMDIIGPSGDVDWSSS